ncbi:MAG: hypothetical protein ABW200_06335 [Hyphomicrobiaceae bacterium]|jgi:hypothetical protein
MSAREDLLERLLDWVVGALGGVRSPCGPADDARLLAPAHEPDADDRRDREREIELRVLMSTWM